MNNKKLIFENKLRNEIIKGIKKAAKAIKITLGPKGKNVIIEKKYGKPIITKDGVTVAKEIESRKKIRNIGIQLLKEVALKTNETAGDGTTTATVIADSMIKNGMKYLTLGIEPVRIKKEINFYIKKVKKELLKKSKKIKSIKEIESVSTISSNNDKKIGKIISNAIKKVGKNGIITIEEGQSTKDELVIVNGMQIEKGYMSPYFLSNLEKEKIILEKPYILVYENKINNFNEIYKILDIISKEGKQLLIIADDIESDALNTLIINSIRGIVKTVAIKTPSFGEKKIQILEDISTLTNAKTINNNIGKKINKTKIKDLGKAEKVIVYKNKTIIFCNKRNNKKIYKRINLIKKNISNSESKFEIKKLKERIAKLSGGVAIIKIGGNSEIEMKERKFRIEDSLNATKAAIEEGILEGGGLALIRISEKLKKNNKNKKNIGLDIVYNSIREPFMQIIRNGNLEPKIIIEKIKKKKEIGLDLIKKKYCNFIKKGIIDPTKVIRLALTNAVSITKLILNTGCVIVNNKGKRK